MDDSILWSGTGESDSLCLRRSALTCAMTLIKEDLDSSRFQEELDAVGDLTAIEILWIWNSMLSLLDNELSSDNLIDRVKLFHIAHSERLLECMSSTAKEMSSLDMPCIRGLL